MAHLNPISLNELKDNATNCRVKRHLISTRSLEHGQPAEIKPDTTIRTQRVKMGYILKDPKLYSKGSKNYRRYQKERALTFLQGPQTFNY